MRVDRHGDALLVGLGPTTRCLSSAVLGGGLGRATHWLNLQVPADYARMDPEAHLRELAAAAALDPATVVGMLTAAHVGAHEVRAEGGVRAVATVGVGHALAAAGRRPRAVARVGTINLLVIVDGGLTDAALVTAVQTATEAKAQALADAGLRAANHPGPPTGTATDSICVATVPGGEVAFAGPATAVGAHLARCVHGAVLAGVVSDRARRRAATAAPPPAPSARPPGPSHAAEAMA